jgi:hypothetical protein
MAEKSSPSIKTEKGLTLIEKLSKIQKELKAPKNQRNTFGNYNYRSCEDILEAVKPLLDDIILTVQDEIVLIGSRYYVKATAELSDGKEKIQGVAYAREAEIKKGMDESQITGAASSYARKYALNGLFLIDDTKDADSMDNKTEQPKQEVKKPAPQPAKPREQALNLLRVKVKQEFGDGDMKEEDVIEIISKKTGAPLKSVKELTEVKAKNLLELWAEKIIKIRL